jgi:hypothetical protein
MLSKFAQHENTQDKNCANTKMSPDTIKSKISFVEPETENDSTIGCELYEGEKTERGQRSNYFGDDLYCDCAGPYINNKKSDSANSETKYESDDSQTVSIKIDPLSSNKTWKDLSGDYEGTRPKERFPLSGSRPVQQGSPISLEFPHATRSNRVSDSPHSKSTESSSESEYSPYTNHEMSRLAAKMDLESPAEDVEISYDEAGALTYSEVAKRKGKHQQNYPEDIGHSSLKYKKSTFEQWMKEKNTPDILSKVNSL